MYLSCESLTQRLKCSYEDKLECLELVKYIVELANIARAEGILILEEHSKKLKIESALLKKGLMLVVDGTDPEIVEKYFLIKLAANDYRGKEFFKNFIIFKGVYGIQQGTGFYSIIVELSSYFGLEFNKYFEDILNDTLKNVYGDRIKDIGNSEIAKKYKNVKPYSEATSHLEKYKDLDNYAIQRVLREVNYITLGYALSGASGEIVTLFLSNVSKRLKQLALTIILDKVSPEIEYIVKYSQKEIVKIVDTLECAGEIVLYPTYRV